MMHGLLRVKNEGRWVGRVIDSMRPVCSDILLLDDDSSDDTRKIAADHGAIVIPTPFSKRGHIHEAEDKDFLLEKLWESGAQIGDWCLMLDGDELLHPADVPLVKSVEDHGWPAYSLRILYLWDREDQYRVDGVYHSFRRPSLFKLEQRNLTFKRTDFGGNFHCSSVPAYHIQAALDPLGALPARVLHLGYLHREDRVRKYEWYNRIDPNDEVEDFYKHMVIGDLLPANTKTRWAGPLELRPLEA